MQSLYNFISLRFAAVRYLNFVQLYRFACLHLKNFCVARIFSKNVE